MRNRFDNVIAYIVEFDNGIAAPVRADS